MCECNICYQEYNKSTRSKTACPSCNFEACKACVRYYITNSIKNAHCMNCKKEFDRDFMVQSLNNAFVTKTYKKHRAGVLMEREKARFPDTMATVARRVKAEGLKEKNKKMDEDIIALRTKLYALEEERRQNERNIRHILSGSSGETKRQQFHRRCPADGCKGFLSSAHKCGLCNIWACPKCFEVIGYNKNDPHTCTEENLKTAEMLKKETKACPGCAAPIYKISGCDQMFCTQCKIAFSWKTGEIENGVIHNPHFYEWQRQTGANIRNPGEVPCGGIPDYWGFSSKMRRARQQGNISESLSIWCMTFHREANHWQHWEIRRLRTQCRDLEDNLELRVDYMMNKISEHEMKSMLISREKSKNKKFAMLHIYELMNTVFTESLTDIYNNCIQSNILKNKERIQKLIVYSNKELARISYVYSQTVKMFDINTFSLVSKKFNKKSYTNYTKPYGENENHANVGATENVKISPSAALKEGH